MRRYNECFVSTRTDCMLSGMSKDDNDNDIANVEEVVGQ
jgi:hypothetical protein